jgi:protein-arginine kinase activator protein McsA
MTDTVTNINERNYVEQLRELNDQWAIAFQSRDWETCALVNDQINALRAAVLASYAPEAKPAE